MDPHHLAAAIEAAGLGNVTHLDRLTVGWETEIWRCHAAGRELAVRVFAPGRGGDVARREGDVLRTLARRGYPVPAVHHVEADPAVAGAAFLVMDLVEGDDLETHPGWSDRERGSLNGQLMARLHRLEPSGLDAYRVDAATAVIRSVTRLAEAAPGLEPVIRWIERHAGSSPPAVPCHNDLHPGNVLIDRAGHPWVVDWTAFAVNDPAVDVAWTMLLAETYGTPEFIDGFLTGYGDPGVHPVAEVLAATRRIRDLLFFASADGAGTVQADADIGDHLPHLTVPAAWVERHTGLRVPEVDMLAGS